MGWESSDVFRFDLGPLSRSNDGSLVLVSCLFGGYKFASVLVEYVSTRYAFRVVKILFFNHHESAIFYGRSRKCVG